MPCREGNKNQAIESLAELVSAVILELHDGDKASIAEIVDALYSSQGYSLEDIDNNLGFAWTKDGGATFAIEESDLFEVLKQVKELLEGKRTLDFSEYYGRLVGLPYNLYFTVREAK